MTVSSTTRKAGPFVGNGSATSFTFSFKVFEDSDVRAVLTVVATGVEADLTLDSDFSVSLNADQNANPGGTVTYPISGSAMASTHKLTLVSVVEPLQETDVVNSGGIALDVVEDALDKSMIVTQQEIEKGDRSLKVSVSDTAPGDLPSAADRANKLLGFDSAGNPVATTIGGGASAPVSAAMTPVVAAVTVASALSQLDGATKGSIQLKTYSAFTSTGSATAFVLTPTPAITALAAGIEFDVAFHTAAGATPTLAVSGLTAKLLKYRDSTGAKQAITSTQLPSGWRSPVVYDGTDWIVRDIPPPPTASANFNTGSFFANQHYPNF